MIVSACRGSLHHGHRRDEQEADGERDVEPDAGLVLAHDREADVGAGRQRQQQRRHLRQAQLVDQPLRRRGRNASRSGPTAR